MHKLYSFSHFSPNTFSHFTLYQTDFTGIVEDNVIVSSNKQGSSQKRKGTGKSSVIPRGKERKHLPHNNFEKLDHIYRPNGDLSTEHWAAEQLSAYNHLLRRGR